MVVVALLGLGEAGGEIAAGLRAAGAEVRGYDVRPELSEQPSAAEAVAGAEIVLSVNAASVAVEAARGAAPGLTAGQVYADLNSAGPSLKREVADVIEPRGAAFADVALMAPVPGRGVAIPALASGSGARAFAAAMGPLGMPVEVLGDEPGEAARRKLLRSVFMKGLAASAGEALAAARAAGCEDWLRAEIAAVLESADAALLDRLDTGSRRHAARRVHEIEDASAMLRELGVEPRVSDASAGWLRELRDGG